MALVHWNQCFKMNAVICIEYDYVKNWRAIWNQMHFYKWMSFGICFFFLPDFLLLKCEFCFLFMSHANYFSTSKYIFLYTDIKQMMISGFVSLEWNWYKQLVLQIIVINEKCLVYGPWIPGSVHNAKCNLYETNQRKIRLFWLIYFLNHC